MERKRYPASLQLLHPNSFEFSPSLTPFLTVSCRVSSGHVWLLHAPFLFRSMLDHSPCMISSTPWSAPCPTFKSIILCHHLSVKQISSIALLTFPPGFHSGISFSIGLKPISTSPLQSVPSPGLLNPSENCDHLPGLPEMQGVSLAPFFLLTSPQVLGLLPYAPQEST